MIRAPSLATQLLMCVIILKTSHRPDGKIADALALILAAQLRMTLRSTTGGVCRRELEKFPLPRWENALPQWDFHMFCACACPLAGRRCVHQQWHGELLIVHHHWQHSLLCACSRSKVPIAPMGKMLTLLLDYRLHNCERCFGQLQAVRAVET